ncbi:glycosyltransferase [bacterium]|nr:glycosyltransferase [bacterium]
MKRPFISIVIANWDGEEWIDRTLSSLQLSARASNLSFEIIVVDDASSDGSVPLIESRFPDVALLRNKKNEGFGATTMRGARAARGSVLVLCNNDLVAKEPFIANLARWFKEPRVQLPGGELFDRASLFAVSARTMAWWDGKPNQLCMGALWQGGRITPSWEDPKQAQRCLFAQAGAAAYNRKHFLRLGGLRPYFSPGYWEDYDLAYHAAKQGMTTIYDPQAVALHVGGGSMTRRFGDEGVARMKARNHLLFEWTNLTDPAMLLRYAARLPISVAREWLSGKPPILSRALLGAIRRAPAVLAERSRRSPSRQTDKALLRRYGSGRPSF